MKKRILFIAVVLFLGGTLIPSDGSTANPQDPKDPKPQEITLEPIITNTERGTMSINSGFYYQQVKSDCGEIRFFKVPVGIGLNPGERLKVPFGAGIYVRYTFYVSGDCFETGYEEETMQSGLYFDAGVKYEASDRLVVSLRATLDLDLTQLYGVKQMSQFLYGYGILLGTRYRIPSKR